ncbi:MAG TPA: AI-2E family transporter [Pseudomonadales bacterium]|nr:AI-2E family transporter [Pseudomonadales bacterium]
MISPEPAPTPPSSAERTLGWAALLVLLVGCLLVLRPFVSALLWAVILCSASWPLYGRLLRLVGNRHGLAASLMTLAMVLTVLVPFIIVGTTLAKNVDDLTGAVRNWIQAGPPAPPQWLGKIPLVGQQAVQTWENLAGDTGELMEKTKEMIPIASSWFLKGGLVLGHGLMQLALSLFIVFFLFRDGAFIAGRVTTAVERIASERGLRMLEVARNTVRGVVYGILGTALVQAVLLGLGLLIARVPGAMLLGLLTFFVSIVPVLGTGLISIPVAIWLFYQGKIGWCIFIVVWGLLVGALDNVVKPWLISQGSDLPFLLIFFGVIGGIVVFGFIGVFVGPTLLSVGFRITEEWIATSQKSAPEILSAEKTSG